MLSTMEILLECYKRYWDTATYFNTLHDDILQNCTWLFLMYTIYILFNSPLALYDLEDKFRKYGDVTYIVISVLSIPLKLCQVSYDQISIDLIKWLWILSITAYYCVYFIFPNYIAPVFESCKKIPDGELKESIKKLAVDTKLEIRSLYVHEGTTYTNKLVGVYGLGSFKILVIYDEVFSKKLTNKEIVAIIAQEIGRWYNYDFYKIVPICISYYIFFYNILSNIFDCDLIYYMLGLEYERPKLVSCTFICLYILLPYYAIGNFVVHIVKHYMEYEADIFVAQLGLNKELQSALIKLYPNNTNCVYDTLYSFWKFDKPTLPERLEALENYERGNVCEILSVPSNFTFKRSGSTIADVVDDDENWTNRLEVTVCRTKNTKSEDYIANMLKKDRKNNETSFIGESKSTYSDSETCIPRKELISIPKLMPISQVVETNLTDINRQITKIQNHFETLKTKIIMKETETTTTNENKTCKTNQNSMRSRTRIPVPDGSLRNKDHKSVKEIASSDPALMKEIRNNLYINLRKRHPAGGKYSLIPYFCQLTDRPKTACVLERHTCKKRTSISSDNSNKYSNLTVDVTNYSITSSLQDELNSGSVASNDSSL